MVSLVSNDIKPHANAIVSMIEQARQNALKSVNAELIQLYWNVGEYLSNESAKASWGDAFIDATANYIKENCPEIRGFTRRGLYRMRQFYETYNGNEFVSPLVTQISWTNHLLILSGAKTIEEKEFYISLCAKEKYSKRELERQMESGYYHRYMLSAKSQPPALATHDDDTYFMDSYVLEFLDLPETFSESDLKHAIVQNLKRKALSLPTDAVQHTAFFCDCVDVIDGNHLFLFFEFFKDALCFLDCVAVPFIIERRQEDVRIGF
jgi:predicted nuclease of restriction endonuclease-like (RecB) superfamily